MAEVDFSDLTSAEAWLKTQSIEVRCAMSSRAALRVLANLRQNDRPHDETVVLACLRSTLTSAGRGSAQSSDVKWGAAARSAAYSVNPGDSPDPADPATDSAGYAARSAAHFADSAYFAIQSIANSANSAVSAANLAARTAVRSTVNSAVGSDAQLVEENEDLLNHRVWTDIEVPSDVLKNHQTFLQYLSGAPKWAFWRDWYLAMWEGRFEDWELAFEVIKITDDVWEAGAEAVAGEIERIRANRSASKAKINETLVLDEDTLLFTAMPLVPSNEERLRRHLSRVEDALDDIITLGGGNGLTENTAQYLIIKRLIRKGYDDPERVAFDLTDVNHSIQRQIKIGEYADDEPLRLLQAANTACVSTICDMEPEVAAELAREFAVTTTPLQEEDALLLQAVWRMSTAMLEAEAASTTAEDAAEVLAGQIIDGTMDPIPEWSPAASAYRAYVLRRQISRLWQQARSLANVPALAKIYDGELSKAAGTVGRFGGAAAIIYAAIRVLGGLLGIG